MPRLYFGGHTYEFVTSARDWAAAAAYAVAQGGYLAVVTSSAENAAILQAALSDPAFLAAAPRANDGGGGAYLWLGGSDAQTEGQWVWTTGAPLGPYLNWAAGPLGREPDDFGGAQDGLAMALQAYPAPVGGIGVAGQWNDVDVRNALYFVVEYDEVRGTDGADVLSGGSGADTMRGQGGDDTLSGGAGRNYLRGDDGDDSIAGGADFDDINGNQGNDTCWSGGGDDWVVGGKGNDSLLGSAGQNLVYGNLGADTCEGGAGADTLRGGQDNDSVSGGAGDDYVSGDRGDDTMAGGAGADIFHSFGETGIDRVTDFSAADGDRVQLDPGTSYAVAQVGADTVITMTGGGQVVLVGVQSSALPQGWLFVG